ncbi:hypothetical protein CLOM621_07945 [Clostridium sp. M62/1]|nr:hypothetical protein CLOM621_07945 [Clostridium sp. M62/1]CBK78017.1 hypothetical protein CLS_26600 [[Clostridium] cf. saccharolyticum K10]
MSMHLTSSSIGMSVGMEPKKTFHTYISRQNIEEKEVQEDD